MSDLCNWIVLVCSFSSRQGVSIRPRCLGVPRVHQDTHGYQLNLVSKAFSLRKWEGWERPCHRPVDSSLRLSFSHHPFPFSKGQNPGNELRLSVNAILKLQHHLGPFFPPPPTEYLTTWTN